LSPSLLQTWRRKHESTPGEGSREGAVVMPLEEENRRLRREIAGLREDREILKKAAAFFAKEPR